MVFSLITAIALAQTPGLPEGLDRDYSASNAAVDAQMDCLRLPAERRHGTFYLWDNCGVTPETKGALNYTANAVLNRTPRIIYPVVVAGGRLLRYNLYDFEPEHYVQGYFRGVKPLKVEFDRLADIDPVFHEPAYTPQVETIRHTVPWYLASDGRYYDYKVETIVRNEKVQAAVGSGGAGPLLLLSDLTGLRQPILAGDWLIPTFWSAIIIDGVQGRYYQLRGIQVGGGNPNDFDAFLAQFGVDPKAFRHLTSAQRTVMKSIVIKRHRLIEITPQTTVPPQYGPGILAVTRDIDNKENDPAKDPLENLIDFKDAAREIIASLPCGLHAYLLTNGQGVAQLEVPPTVAAWPHSPHGDIGGGTMQLVPGISCLECHGPQRGWNPTRNLVRELKEDGFAAKFDFRVGRYSAREFLDLISDLYDGEIDFPLSQAGAGYAIAADKATLGCFGVKSVEGVSAEIFRIYASYFKEVDASRALTNLGYKWSGKPSEFKIKQAFNSVIPPRDDDPGRVGVLRLNRPITRAEWNQIAFELSLRDVVRAEAPPFGGPGKVADGKMQRGAAPEEKPGPALRRFRDRPSTVGRFAEAAKPTFRTAEPTRVAEKAKPTNPVEISYQPGDGLAVWGPPYARLKMWDQDLGTLGPGGYRAFARNHLMQPGEVWPNCPLTVGEDSFQVEVRTDRRVAVVVRRNAR